MKRLSTLFRNGSQPANEPAPARGRPNRGFGRDAAMAIAGGAAAVVLARNFFESEKKITEELKVDYDVHDPQFGRTMSQFLGPPLLKGNCVQVLENGDEIFPAMLEAIRSARRTITFENFVFSRGTLTEQFASALAERARNGVKVHFLQDAMGCNCIHGREIKLMEESGVEVEIFRYVNWQFNERTHRKLLIIDGSLGFIGGVGISDQWLGSGVGPERWRDTQYRVEGPVVAQMQQAFLDNWVQTRSCLLHGDLYFPQLKECGDITCQAFKSSSCEGADSARLMFLFSIAAARKSIRIGNAYFIPDDLLVDTLCRAAERGVTIEVITCGPLIDQHLARYVGRSRWYRMMKCGIRFYEYKPARYHCKYMIVDDVWSCVGSCNFDNRSLRLNEEANLNVLDTRFAVEHSRVFDHDKSESHEITMEEWLDRPLAEKIQGHLGCLLRSQL
jgi:cardiolipin synthase